MRLALKPHPDSPSTAIASVEVEVTRLGDSALSLSYIVAGQTERLRLPSPAASTRTDGLWQHTCFEAFLTVQPDNGYYEFNFSPSTQWAAYRFNDYRQGMVALAVDPPEIEVAPGDETFTLRASLSLEPSHFAVGARLGLSAVIEETNGTKSYWALAHGPGKPDFHRADCFTHEFS
jgi:hypothetical protein